MTRLKMVMLAIVICSLSACVTPQLARTGGETKTEFPPTSIESVDIYRSADPPWKYSEIGIITLQGLSDIRTIFKKFRIEAAKIGATAVIDFDLESEKKEVTVSEVRTDSEGNSRTVYTTERHVTHTASGTLVRKN